MNTHIIRYAKSHYGKSNYPIEDLKILISKWSGTDVEYLTERDVLECVHSVWNEIVGDFDRKSLMRELFYSGHHRSNFDLRNGEVNVEVTIMTLLGGMVPVQVSDLPVLEDMYDIHFELQYHEDEHHGS